jgi:ADP-glucose pyrophosphorylase
MSQKDQFYFQGKYFDNSEDMFAYSTEWLKLSLDEETADRQMNILNKYIIMNIFLRGIKFNNHEFNEYLDRIFEFAINEFPKNK